MCHKGSWGVVFPADFSQKVLSVNVLAGKGISFLHLFIGTHGDMSSKVRDGGR